MRIAERWRPNSRENVSFGVVNYAKLPSRSTDYWLGLDAAMLRTDN